MALKIKERELPVLAKAITGAVELAIATTVAETHKIKVISQIGSTSLMPTELQPEGYQFTVTVQVAVHEDTRPPKQE